MKKDRHIDSQKRLLHLEEAIEIIENYTLDENAESFCSNHLIHDAVLFQFLVIGEAIQYVEDDILVKYEYPWHKVRSFRNLIAHEYFNIKLIAVWKIIVVDLPGLKEIVLKIIASEF
jgi:uncharacterized protein with HEPN domain